MNEIPGQKNVENNYKEIKHFQCVVDRSTRVCKGQKSNLIYCFAGAISSPKGELSVLT